VASKQNPKHGEGMSRRLKELVSKPTNLAFPLIILLLILMGVTAPLGVKSLLIEMMIFSIYALAFDILFGFSNQFSFGQALFFGVGAYGVLLPILHMNVNLWTAILTGLILCLVFAFALGPMAVRLSEDYFVIITIIFNMVFYLLALSWEWITGGDDGLSITVPPIPLGFASYSIYDPTVNYLFTLSFLVVAYLILKRITESPLGRILISIRENEERARFLGYDVIRYKLIAYIISALFTGLAGALYTIRLKYASAEFFSIVISIEPVLWTLIGGAGTLIGPILGVVILTLIIYYVGVWWRHYLILIGALLILILRVSPKGIIGYITSKIR
jgi:branched-chain amino acid transport system permease protein